jgi:primosomal protein N' (replication factor Y)
MGQAATRNTSGFLWVEEGRPRQGTIAEVAPLIPVHRTYSYAVPEDLAGSASLGQRAMIRMGRRGRPVRAFIVGLDRGEWDATLRPIDSLVDQESYLTPELIRLGREIALHYCCPLGVTLKAMTAESVRQGRGLRTVRYVRLGEPLEAIERTGRIGPKQRALLDSLAARCTAVAADELLRDIGASSAVLRSTVEKGWVTVEVRKERREPKGTEAEHPADLEPNFILKDEQAAALVEVVGAIETGRFAVMLLYGVSGAGKTEVYIRAMQHVLGQGKQALLLVPEIMLTTQLVQRLAARFERAAVMHSGLTESQRSLVWRRVAEGEAAVVIGTRSAVFAPFPNLGLICVDEEQESSYKNLQAPRFHTRDVAIMRAKNLGIPVVLGSATPSIETWYHSDHRPDYRRLVLRRRINEQPMPVVHIVDMHEEYAERKHTVVLSRLMERLLEETLQRGEQSLLLMNRRGFANRLYCPECRMRVTCPNCNVGLVVHVQSGQCVCHYCRMRTPIPQLCPNVTCGERLVQVGVGTERVEDIIAQRFPRARIQRVDSDTMRHRDEYQRVVRQFEARELDMLIGTQMIAKGLDFPFVSFVGVIHADSAALAADFRAHERMFQLITQVAGRAGRADAPGRVVVQTTSPELPALRFALEHDYEAFAAAELALRKRYGLPPFRRLARIELSHEREATVRSEAEALARRIGEQMRAIRLEHAEVAGPNPCILPRLRGKYRYDLLIFVSTASDLRALLSGMHQENVLRTKLKSVVMDVDPVEMA